MDSLFQTERTATATSSTNITTTNKVASIITSISDTSRSTGRPATDTRRELCWCGQDMDVVRGCHCPRCGTMRSARVGARGGAVLPRLAV